MKVIVPCCGRSTRFPNLPPKWMLPGADGRPMICAAVEGIGCNVTDLIITILREHEEKYGATAGLAAAFGAPVQVCILERQTRSQSETVAETLRALRLDEPFLVKDSDGAFELPRVEADDGYVCVESLNNHPLLNPQNKSYVRVTEQDRITTIREKEVISDLFSVGGYFFRTPELFLHYYDRLSSDSGAGSPEMYLSVVIGAMVKDGVVFRARNVTHYRDWGTLEDWRRAIGATSTVTDTFEGFRFDSGTGSFRSHGT